MYRCGGNCLGRSLGNTSLYCCMIHDGPSNSSFFSSSSDFILGWAKQRYTSLPRCRSSRFICIHDMTFNRSLICFISSLLPVGDVCGFFPFVRSGDDSVIYLTFVFCL